MSKRIKRPSAEEEIHLPKWPAETHHRHEPSGCEIELQALQIEYGNLFDRSNKLDNKVYITITFCGFLFVFITGLFAGVPSIYTHTAIYEQIMIWLYLLLCVAVILSYVGNLVYLMRLLKPEGIIRMDPDEMASMKLYAKRGDQACLPLMLQYRKIININLDKLHERCDHFTRGIRFVVINVILAFCAYAYQMLLHMAIN